MEFATYPTLLYSVHRNQWPLVGQSCGWQPVEIWERRSVLGCALFYKTQMYFRDCNSVNQDKNSTYMTDYMVFIWLISIYIPLKYVSGISCSTQHDMFEICWKQWKTYSAWNCVQVHGQSIKFSSLWCMINRWPKWPIALTTHVSGCIDSKDTQK